MGYGAVLKANSVSVITAAKYRVLFKNQARDAEVRRLSLTTNFPVRRFQVCDVKAA